MHSDKKAGKEKNHIPLRAKIAHILDMPMDILQKQEVSIVGDHTCAVNGCIHIEEYDPGHILVKTTEGIVCLYGDMLSILSFSDDCITVCGKILSVEMRKGKRDEV